MLATLVPTVLMTAVGIVLLAVGSGSVTVVAGVLLLAFCTTSLTGYILGSIFVSRGASLASVQNDFVSSVSHELRTPLTSIRIFIETLRSQRLTDPKEKQQCLDLLYKEVGRLEELVERLIELSRIESGRQPTAWEKVPVEDLIYDALSAFDAASLSQPVKVDVQVDDGLSVVGDRALLGQMLTNLLINAWKYTPKENKKISIVATNSRGKHAQIKVQDNGSGIPRSEHKDVFVRFQRGQAAVNSGSGGLGLGLAIVKAIVRAHKGSIEIHSQPQEGTEFHIRLRC